MTKIVSMPNAVLLGEARRLIQEGHTVTLTVRGFSMRPFLEDRRDKAVLAPCSEVKKGDVVLAEIAPGTYVLHRIVALDGDKVTLMGDGNVAGRETCHRTDIAGSAIAFYRKGNGTPVTVESRLWKTYSAFWTNTLPARRYMLAFYRRVWLKLFRHSSNSIIHET